MNCKNRKPKVVKKNNCTRKLYRRQKTQRIVDELIWTWLHRKNAQDRSWVVINKRFKTTP